MSGRLLFRALPVLAAFALAAPASGAPEPKAPGGAGGVIVVGWDGADWKLLDALMASGRLPNLSSLTARGRTWDLASYQPFASPLVWTTIATGRSPLDHGVTDFQEIDPATRLRIPVSGRSRKVPAIWNAASAKGVTTGVVGWWATWPAERVDGFLVSDRAVPAVSDGESPSRSQAITWPEGIADGVRLVVRREAAPPWEDVSKSLSVSRAEFDAAVASNPEPLRNPITGFRKILGETRATARIALGLYDREKPRLLMVYFQGTDEIGHILGKYHPPRLATVPESEFQKYSRGVTAIYEESDRFLGELLQRARRDSKTLILLSDHGFRWAADRPTSLPGDRFDTAYRWHEKMGVLAAAGSAVVPSARRGKATVFDIAPTLCRLLGLPPDPAFEGKLIEGFSGPAVPRSSAPARWSSFARVERLDPSAPVDRRQAEEFTRQLLALGYLAGREAPAVDTRTNGRTVTQTSGSFQNIGTYLRERGRIRESIPWFRKAVEASPKSGSAWMGLSEGLLRTGDRTGSDEAFFSALRAGYADAGSAATARLAVLDREAQKDPAAKRRRSRFLERLTALEPANLRWRAAFGRALFESGECARSEAVFAEISARVPDDVETLNLRALSLLCQGRPDDARPFFERSLALRPGQPAVLDALRSLKPPAKPGSTPRRKE